MSSFSSALRSENSGSSRTRNRPYIGGDAGEKGAGDRPAAGAGPPRTRTNGRRIPAQGTEHGTGLVDTVVVDQPRPATDLAETEPAGTGTAPADPDPTQTGTTEAEVIEAGAAETETAETETAETETDEAKAETAEADEAAAEAGVADAAETPGANDATQLLDPVDATRVIETGDATQVIPTGDATQVIDTSGATQVLHPQVPDQRTAPDGAREVWSLVERAQNGDAQAFGLIYDRYVDTVFRFIYFRVGNRHLAEDLTSETFVRALKRIGSFTWQGRDLGAWLVTIARNLVADHFKSGRYRLEVTTGDVLDADREDRGPEGSPEAAVVDHITNVALLTAVRQLNAEQQECIVLRFLQGFSVAETAQAMGKNEGAIKALQYRAVRALARLLPDGFQP